MRRSVWQSSINKTIGRLRRCFGKNPLTQRSITMHHLKLIVQIAAVTAVLILAFFAASYVATYFSHQHLTVGMDFLVFVSLTAAFCTIFVGWMASVSALVNNHHNRFLVTAKQWRKQDRRMASYLRTRSWTPKSWRITLVICLFLMKNLILIIKLR